jgi:hypothetical protein
MSQETHQKLDDIRQTILKLRDVADAVFDELHTKISKLLALVEIQKKLNEIARTIREGNTLPVRRINYNIKKLAEDDEACQIRWSKMRKLNCPAIMFSTMAFNGLISLPDKQYECLWRTCRIMLKSKSYLVNGLHVTRLEGLSQAHRGARVPSHFYRVSFAPR